MIRALLLLAVPWLSAQPLPRFADFPAAEIYRGQPAAPKLLTESDRQFRTRIRQGAAAGPVFAGHIAIAQWGCGSACVSMALIDSQTGQVYPAPFSILGQTLPRAIYDGNIPANDVQPLSYQRNIRLLIVRGCPEDANCASYFYEWTGSGLKLLRKISVTAATR